MDAETFDEAVVLLETGQGGALGHVIGVFGIVVSIGLEPAGWWRVALRERGSFGETEIWEGVEVEVEGSDDREEFPDVGAEGLMEVTADSEIAVMSWRERTDTM